VSLPRARPDPVEGASGGAGKVDQVEGEASSAGAADPVEAPTPPMSSLHRRVGGRSSERVADPTSSRSSGRVADQ
jgi:hypothetical protein